MTKTRLVGALISVFVTSACGGDEETAQLEGIWGIQRADGCAVLFRYDADGSCAFGTACELQSGDIGIERHEGTCELQGDQLTARWERSTCESTSPVYGAEYELTEERLVLINDGGRLVFQRLEDDGMGNAIVRYGCWDGDALVFRDLLPL